MKKGLVFMLDMINLNNVYVLSSKINNFVEENSSGREELAKIAKIVNNSSEELSVD